MKWDVHHPNEAELEAGLPRSVGDLLHERAHGTPQREAFVFFDHDVVVTYAELYEQVRRVAKGLSSNGVRKGTRLALMLNNCLEFPVTWLACAWLGAITVQLNPKFTGKELDYALNDADVDYLLIDHTCLSALAGMEQRSERLPDANIIVRSSDSQTSAYLDWTELLKFEPFDEQAPHDVGQHDVLSILYTSGTTGFPKGCMLDHRYWLQLASTAVFAQGGHIPRNILIYEPMFYMQGNAIFVAALLCNATVYAPERPSISRFFGWVRRYDIDYCAFPVPAVHVMEEHPPEMGASLAWVHAWYFHGDARARVEERFDAVARDSYGMTENGLCLYVPVDRPDIAEAGSVGVPAPWRSLRIVDEQGNDLPDGEVGELWTAGPGHMHGYYRKTTANRENFVGPWFRTGDLMRRDASGAYFLVGRMKDMIKRSGENISAAEVEACLSKLAGVVMAAVVAVPDEARDEEIKAYIQLKPEISRETLSPEVVFEHCRKHLAAFKLPRYLAYVESLPLTAGNDKVSKPKLIANVRDLRLEAYDRVDGIWR